MSRCQATLTTSTATSTATTPPPYAEPSASGFCARELRIWVVCAGLLIVSHDQYLLQSVVDELWVVGGGTMKRFEGDFIEYKKSLSTGSS